MCLKRNEVRSMSSLFKHFSDELMIYANEFGIYEILQFTLKKHRLSIQIEQIRAQTFAW